MKNTNAIRALLSLVLCCLPLSAATISQDEISMSLGFDAVLVGRNHYEVLAGGVVLMEVQAPRGQLLWIFATPDLQGRPDYANFMTLFLDRIQGTYSAAVEIPAELRGATFHLQAWSQGRQGPPTVGPDLLIDVVEQLQQAPHSSNEGSGK